jgi:Ca-activated chloride channel family protein
MRRTVFVSALVCALVALSAAAGSAAAEDIHPMFRLEPELGLAPLAADHDLGLPVDADPALLAELARVRTEPGALPQLELTLDGGKKLALPLEHTDVRAEVSGFIARVEVTQRYKNPMTRPIEAIYVFPLPENSAVDDMKIRVGDRLIEAEIQRRAEARHTYETARREGYTAALLEQERPNVFTQSVANIPPGEDIDVVIRYVQDLTYDAGAYEFVFPMVVGPRFIPGSATGRTGPGWSPDTDAVPDASRITPPVVGGGRRTGHDISVEVVIDPGLPVVDFTVPTHQVEAAVADGATVITLAEKDSIPNRDFVLRFRVDQDEPQGALYAHRSGKHGGVFSLVVQPPTLDVDALLGQREIVFVIDISGSMWGRPIAMAKDAAREAIRRLRPVDTFNVVTFAGQTAKAFPASRPANQTNIKLAFDFIAAAQAGGGTYLADAVKTVLSPQVEDGRDRIVVFLTDGYVGNEAGIIADVERFLQAHRQEGRRARAFGFGVGSSVNRFLLDGVGKAGDGAAVYLTTREDPVQAVDTMSRLIDHPILSDVRIDWGGLAVSDVEPARIPDLLASRPLILHGRYKAAGAGTVVVSGKANGKRVKVEIPVVLPQAESKNGVLETLWARARIESLSRALWDGEDKEVVETITGLGLDYRIVTAYTSFVAVDRSRKVGDGDPTTIVQPIDAPEGVTPEMAAPVQGLLGGMGGGVGYGGGGVGGRGVGALGKVGPAKLMRAPAPLTLTVGDTSGRGRAGEVRTHATVSPAEEPLAAVEKEDEKADEKADEKDADRSVEKPADARVRGVARSVALAVEGAFDKAIVERVVRARLSAVRHCYERRLTSAPRLKGQLDLAWIIDASGLVKDARVTADTVGDAELAACVVQQVQRWRFPAPKGTAKVTWSVALKTGE